MLTQRNFERNANVVKWSWSYSPQQCRAGRVCITLMDWQSGESRDISYTVSWSDYVSYTQSRGVNLQLGNLNDPAMIEVWEDQEVGGQRQRIGQLLQVPLPARYKYQICLKRTKAENGSQKLTVTYPDCDVVYPGSYSEKMLYFLVSKYEESSEGGARFYLPRPDDSRVQEFWFVDDAQYRVQLCMDPDAPVGSSGLFKARDVFELA